MQLGDKSLRAENSVSLLITTVTPGKQVCFRLSDGHFYFFGTCFDIMIIGNPVHNFVLL